MSRYINADLLLENLKSQYGKDLGWQCTVNMSDVGMMIEDAPAADVQEVKHGKWIRDAETDGFRCSECGHLTNERLLKWYQVINEEVCNVCYKSANPFYCSRCGAKMQLEDETNDH